MKNKRLASSKQEENKGKYYAMFLIARDAYTNANDTIAFGKFSVLLMLGILQFGLTLLNHFLLSLLQLVEFLISILSCIIRRGFFVSRKLSVRTFE